MIKVSKDLSKQRSVNSLCNQDNKKDKIIEIFNYSCNGCYDLQRYMFFWKKSDLLIKKQLNNYYIPINLYSYWFFLSKAYYTSVRLNTIDLFHQNIFFNIHYNNIYDHKVDNIKTYFENNNVDEKIFFKTINSFTILKDIKNTSFIKKDLFLSETPSIIICLRNKIFILTLPKQSTSTIPIVNELNDILSHSKK